MSQTRVLYEKVLGVLGVHFKIRYSSYSFLMCNQNKVLCHWRFRPNEEVLVLEYSDSKYTETYVDFVSCMLGMLPHAKYSEYKLG